MFSFLLVFAKQLEFLELAAIVKKLLMILGLKLKDPFLKCTWKQRKQNYNRLMAANWVRVALIWTKEARKAYGLPQTPAKKTKKTQAINAKLRNCVRFYIQTITVTPSAHNPYPRSLVGRGSVARHFFMGWGLLSHACTFTQCTKDISKK